MATYLADRVIVYDGEPGIEVGHTSTHYLPEIVVFDWNHQMVTWNSGDRKRQALANYL